MCSGHEGQLGLSRTQVFLWVFHSTVLNVLHNTCVLLSLWGHMCLFLGILVALTLSRQLGTLKWSQTVQVCPYVQFCTASSLPEKQLSAEGDQRLNAGFWRGKGPKRLHAFAGLDLSDLKSPSILVLSFPVHCWKPKTIQVESLCVKSLWERGCGVAQAWMPKSH